MKIVVDHVRGSRRGQRQELDPTARIRFGRHPANEVTFDAHRDLDASSRHAELVGDGTRFVLRDVGSSNGLFVGGERVDEVPVPIGETVEVAFGLAGPRVRLFIGEPDDVPDPPSASSLRVPRAEGEPPPRAPHTMAQMWRAAADRAGAAQGLGKPAAFARGLADEAVNRSSRAFKVVLSLIATVGLALAGAWLLGRGGGDRAPEPRAAGPRPLPAPADAAAPAPEPPRAAGRAGAVYLLVAERRGESVAFCAAFAVAPRHLGTRAHCAEEARRRQREGAAVRAVRHGAAERIAVRRLVPHARYAGGPADDAALVEVDAEVEPVALADEPRLRRLAAGDNVFALRFPARLAQAIGADEAPAAEVVAGVVGRVADLAGELGPYGTRRLVQHSLPTGGATPGGPVFDGEGAVVAVDVGPLDEAGANYAVRIDALQEVLRDNGLLVTAAGGRE